MLGQQHWRSASKPHRARSRAPRIIEASQKDGAAAPGGLILPDGGASAKRWRYFTFGRYFNFSALRIGNVKGVGAGRGGLEI